MSIVTDPSTTTTTTVVLTTPRPSFQPHRRLYRHQGTAQPSSSSSSVSISNQPLMLLPKAKLHDDNDDLLHRRFFAVVPDNGLETLRLSAISGVSGWIGADGGGRGRGGGEGGGGYGGRRMGRRPLTSFDFNARRRMKEIVAAMSDRSDEDDEGEFEGVCDYCIVLY